MKYFSGGITIKEKEIFEVMKKVEELKNKDDAVYNKKIEELKNTIGKEKVDKKLKEIDEKYGDKLNQYAEKMQEFNKNATNNEKAEMIMEMKNKLSAADQKKFDKAINIFKKYMNKI